MKLYYCYVYMMANERRTALYTGVTNELRIRVYEHKMKIDPKSFTARYNCNKLVYYEGFDEIKEAIKREKQIKRWRREKKEFLINKDNPEWRDLYDDLRKL